MKNEEYLNLIGKKYNMLTILKFKKNNKGTGGRYDCVCDCGKTVNLMACQVINGRNKSCGCLQKHDVIGKKFGKLTVYSQYRRNNRSWVNCICDCGNIAQIELYKAMTYHTKSCGCIRKTNPSSKKEAGVAAKNSVFCSYKQSAAIRNLTFSLTDKELYNLLTDNCYYCGSEPSNVMRVKSGNGVFLYNGIDRKDNNAGYTIENCVSCCKNCNFMKRKMSIKEFYEHIDKISNFLKNKSII